MGGDQAPPGEIRPPGYAGQPVGTFLDGLASPAAAPAGGSAAALAVALGAALCAKCARLSTRQLTDDDVALMTHEAEQIRTAAALLIDADALAYRAVIEQSKPADGLEPDRADPGRAERLAAALSGAAEVPMRIVELAAAATELAADLASRGNPWLRGDAITAVRLAQAGARAAATLVGINLAALPDDDRPARSAELLARIARSADRAP